jgi:hypothetical protein
MRQYGPAHTLVQRLVDRAGKLTLDEAADVYQAHAARILIQGVTAERLALARARREAVRSGRQVAYDLARREAVTAWRHGLPDVQGPWLMVGAAIANAAAALVVEDLLDDRTFHLLLGPWEQAVGRLVPVGPGAPVNEHAPATAERIG